MEWHEEAPLRPHPLPMQLGALGSIRRSFVLRVVEMTLDLRACGLMPSRKDLKIETYKV